MEPDSFDDALWSDTDLPLEPPSDTPDMPVPPPHPPCGEYPPPKVPPYWQSVPGPADDAPRDGQHIERGKDILFLATALKNFRWPMRWLKRFVLRNTPQQRYLLERKDGVLIHLVTLEETTPEEEWIPTQAISARALRRRVREHFYAFRRVLPIIARGTVAINGHTLVEDGEPRAAHAEFMDSLRLPVRKADDPILDHLAEVKFLEFGDVRVASPLDALCPLDGPVRPMLLEIISPNWTWKNLCGRHWASALCPRCLGEFTAQLVALN